jgi:hypothetical protein
MQDLIYNIPVELARAFQGRKVIVRSADASTLVHALPEKRLEDVVAVQLLPPHREADILARWGWAIPVEIVVQDPAKEYALLYRFARLLDKHPIRISIPALAGLEKAVKVATSLQFQVKLELGQPDSKTVNELRRALDLYLHQSSVSQPVEPFDGLLKGMFHDTPRTLWDIQEEDPSLVRFVLPDGSETIARPPFTPPSADLQHFIQTLQETLFATKAECCSCPFFKNCGGYFKWPLSAFPCDDIKSLLNAVHDAASELRADLKAFDTSRVQGQS